VWEGCLYQPPHPSPLKDFHLMQTNTVQTLIDSIKDLTGQTNLSDAKAVRALNFGVDDYSKVVLLSSGKYAWDSRNQADIQRVTVTSSDATLDIENELVLVKEVELLINGKYKRLTPTDQRDDHYQENKSSSGTPDSYDLDGQVIRPLPVPDTAYTYRLTFGRAHPRFSVDNLTQDTGVLPIDEEYVVLYASKYVMTGTNDPSINNIKNDLFEKKEGIKDLFSKRDQDTPRRLKANIPSAFRQRSRGKR